MVVGLLPSVVETFTYTQFTLIPTEKSRNLVLNQKPEMDGTFLQSMGHSITKAIFIIVI